MKILKYYNSTILYKSPKNPIFVQLSPIQCTYSNIFIRFFKFFPANTNIYQISYRVIGVLCGLSQGVLSSQCGYLISFGTKYSVIASVAWQSPGREPYYKTHARYFCTCVEKKAHTNKRVSIIACNNVISKVQCTPITLYEFW